jgi:hypothetical protein
MNQILVPSSLVLRMSRENVRLEPKLNMSYLASFTNASDLLGCLSNDGVGLLACNLRMRCSFGIISVIWSGDVGRNLSSLALRARAGAVRDKAANLSLWGHFCWSKRARELVSFKFRTIPKPGFSVGAHRELFEQGSGLFRSCSVGKNPRKHQYQ